jgi:ribose 5-phosphate isomerase B
MKIILAADHAGYNIKEIIKKHLLSKSGLEVLDVGAHELNPDDDYPVYMSAAALKVAEDISGNTKAIIFGGSGQGEAMVANRFPGARCTVWYGGDKNILTVSREHNDANILSVGARFVNEKTISEDIDIWLNTQFSGEERHARRIELIDNIE